RRTRRRKELTENPLWFPWPDKETCVLDILRHLPRAAFSDAQMEVILWGLAVMGVNSLPSQKVLKDVDALLQSYCGVDTERHEGRLGHIYYVNHLASIIAQELANPTIRRHVHHYPEDAGQHLSETWQASRWLHEIDPSLGTPMIRVGSQDYYVFEPTKLVDGSVVIPERWFVRKTMQGNSHHEMYWARAWRCRAVPYNDGRLGYEVDQWNVVEVPAHDLLLSFPNFVATFEGDHLPDPRLIKGSHQTLRELWCSLTLIEGVVKEARGEMTDWSLTDPNHGNRWRSRSRGHRVVSFLIWLYCDDTSGNLSKKWNKHNSFLFTAAGLPRVLAQKEGNIHFLTTSNIAPPLEMLDGIVTQLEDGQTNGIWAWDVEAKEMILVIPAVLAMLGDNPMQSELACHIGLKGKFFCRCCWVKGHDVDDADVPNPSTGGRDSEASSQASVSEAGQSGGEEGSSPAVGIKAKAKGRRKETMQELADRARRFLGDSRMRDRDDTVQKLTSMFKDVASEGTKTQFQKAKTETGLKDTFMEFFVDRIFSRLKGLRGSARVNARRQMGENNDIRPEDVMSPVWRIKGLDPHKDTPVEILHVILLGFVKYFWRDVISRLNDTQKSCLVTRLNSFQVSGLAVSPLAGQTLVQYAGSLTGRDFRVISQVAPFILYDLVPKECYESWLSLSALVPLVWQPGTDHLDVHLNEIQQSIDHFLTCTARWTPRWFNKPKFHIVKHLVFHIRRFGPAILFATEGFESFNGVIRAHSVHSNHQAPSRDIGRGFARCNRIRHLLSGGRFMPRRKEDADHRQENHNRTYDEQRRRDMPYSNDEKDWRSAGQYACSLTHVRMTGVGRNVIGDYFGLNPAERVDSPLRLFQTCQAAHAVNGDKFTLYDFVLSTPVSQDPVTTLPVIGRVSEILQICHSTAQRDNAANFVLLETFSVVGKSPMYGLPLLRTEGWKLVGPTTVLCTINVQHNCAAHACEAVPIAPVREEREVTKKRELRVEHRNIEDLILNTAQMRDAVHVQRFRISAPPLDREFAIYAGAAAEVEAQKLKDQHSTTTKLKGKQPARMSALRRK
ncbi:hypothetical protein HYDPIDRAFT_103839, partial [Hydnomerulius pinastri MD-312]